MRYGSTSRLARYLAVAYGLLIAYASLHPFTGWRHSGTPWLAFLGADWPRYFTYTDLTLNTLAYLPLGFLLMPALRTRFKAGWAFLLTALIGALFSLGMEIIQNALPSRVPSNTDVACNTVGTLLGALAGGRWGGIFADGTWLHRWRMRRVIPGQPGEMGLILLGLWLLAQLNPESLLFGTGEIARYLEVPSPVEFSAERFQQAEFAVAASQTFAVGLLGWRCMNQRSRSILVAVLLLSLAVRTLATAVLQAGVSPLHWATPGNLAGFASGAAALILALLLPAAAQRILATLALIAGALLVNMAPENPYLLEELSTWKQGHFLNFNGLTRLTSSLWPYLALIWLLSLRPVLPKSKKH